MVERLKDEEAIETENQLVVSKVLVFFHPQQIARRNASNAFLNGSERSQHLLLRKSYNI